MLKKPFLKKIKEKLLQEKLELEGKTLQKVVVDIDGDETDEIQGNMLIDMENKLFSRNKEKLHKINDALKRIDDNTYGICFDCEEDIPEKRLLANPYFTICVICAEDRENEIKRKRLHK